MDGPEAAAAAHIFAAALQMLWFVSGAIGFIELLRYLQRVCAPLRRRWPQAALFGIATGTLMGLLHGVLGAADIKGLGLITPFLALLAGPEGAIVGGLALAIAIPQQALATLLTAATAALLARYRRPALFALPVGWLVIGLQGPLFELLRGRAFDPLLSVAASALGAIALYLYVREVDLRRLELLHAEARATTDPLTGMLNRPGLTEWLVQARTGALLAIDLDDFKPVNELYGHAAGDQVLREAAQRLRLALRPGDALARLGGDEFAAGIAGADLETAISVAERMLAALDHEDLVLPAGQVRLRASFGVAIGPLPQLFEPADAALLRAKAEGKGRISVHGESRCRDLEEDQLLRVTSFVRELLFSFDEGIVILGKSRRIVAVSPGYEALTGYQEAQAQGRKPRSLIGTEITDPVSFGEIAAHLDREGSWRGELVNRRPSGEIWWADWSMRTLEVRGKRLGYIGIARDTTPLHRHDAELLAEAIGVLSEKHDPSVYGHLQRTGQYMELLAAAWQQQNGRAELPLNPAEYRVAAMMHDIGKLSVPMQILSKPGPLSDEEREIINWHAADGHAYLQELCARWCRGPRSDYTRMLLDVAMEIVLRHHERVDGSGYPSGLRRGRIPLAARLFSVVDVYDALRGERPYKRAWSEEEAWEYLERGAGIAFDAEAVWLLGELRRDPTWQSIDADESVREA